MPRLQLRTHVQLRAASAVAVLLLTGLVGPGLASSAAADRVFQVDSLLDAVDVSVGDGACRTAAGTCTLRAAVQEANVAPVPSQIALPAGRFVFSLRSPAPGVPNVNEPETGDLDLLRPVTIRGLGARQTIIDTKGLDRAFSNVHLNVATLQDLAITGGRFGRTDSWSGGAVWNEGVMTLERVHLFDNEAGYGGAVFNTPRTHMVIRDSLLENNRSGEGGAVRFDASGEVVNTTITGNSVFEVDQTRRPRELSGYGGGIDHRGGGDLVIVNSTITGNSALKGGGGLNTSFAYVGGAAGQVSPRAVRLYNTIIAGNTSVQGEQDCRAAGLPLLSLGHVLDGDGTCGTTGATDLPKRDPRLSGLRDHGGPTDTLMPHRRSPAVDAGGADGCPPADQRGRQRTGTCDIGAVER